MCKQKLLLEELLLFSCPSLMTYMNNSESGSLLHKFLSIHRVSTKKYIHVHTVHTLLTTINN